MNKFIVLTLLCSVILLAGCTQQAPQPTATPAPNVTVNATPVPTATPTPAPVSVTPLRLDYQFEQGQGPQGPQGQSQETYLTLWLNEERDCSGKTAFIGLMSTRDNATTPDDRARWLKATVFKDDGVMAVSKSISKSDLAFDTATSAAMDFDYFLTLNNWFAQAGRNFNNDEVWNSTIPVILKNVKVGDSVFNISVVKGDDSNAYAVPCTKFSILTQGGGPQEMTVCAAKTSEEMPLPFIVSFTVGNNNFNISLTKVSRESSSAAYYPQCMSVVTCSAVPQPTNAQQQECSQRNGTFDSVRDETDCVSSRVCRTNRERAIQDIQGRERPGCPQPSEELITKVLACRENQGRNYQQGNDGCIEDVIC